LGTRAAVSAAHQASNSARLRPSASQTFAIESPLPSCLSLRLATDSMPTPPARIATRPEERTLPLADEIPRYVSVRTDPAIGPGAPSGEGDFTPRLSPRGWFAEW